MTTISQSLPVANCFTSVERKCVNTKERQCANTKEREYANNKERACANPVLKGRPFLINNKIQYI